MLRVISFLDRILPFLETLHFVAKGDHGRIVRRLIWVYTVRSWPVNRVTQLKLIFSPDKFQILFYLIFCFDYIIPNAYADDI